MELLKRYDQSGDGNLDAKELKQLIRDDLKVPASAVSNAEIEPLVAALHRQTLGAISVGDLADRELAAAVVVERGDERFDLDVRPCVWSAVLCFVFALECSSGTKVDLWRCFLIPRLVMGGNGAGWPSESKKT